MSHGVGLWVARRWYWVLVAWLLVAVGVKLGSPRWNDVAADGDIAFLPQDVPSAIGKRKLEAAFPGAGSNSQVIAAIARPDASLMDVDIAVALDIVRQLHWMAAHSAARQLGLDALPDESVGEDDVALAPGLDETLVSIDASQDLWLEILIENAEQVIEVEESLRAFHRRHPEFQAFQYLPATRLLRGQAFAKQGKLREAQVDFEIERMIGEQSLVMPVTLPEWSTAIRDVASWRSRIIGHKLGQNHSQIRLISMQLATEFTATRNIALVNGCESLIRSSRSRYGLADDAALKTELSGSAMVGADMLRASASAVKQTEYVTVVLVLLILVLVYRSPLLVAIPLTSIALSLVVATSVVALLARDPADLQSSGLGVFTTTRIFVVVLLFGAGTDFCLFFLARCRELVEQQRTPDMTQIVSIAWASVHRALIASALTTIVGLALMWFSQFEKFKFSGPIIAISLAVTLAVCLSFTPALLRALGRAAFWPQIPLRRDVGLNRKVRPANRYWKRIATLVVARPGWAITTTLLVLGVPAVYGAARLSSVTYNLTEELSFDAPSRQGERLIKSVLPEAHAAPVTLLVERDKAFESEQQLRQACESLSKQLYGPHVTAVRNLSDPLGDYPPGKRMSLFGDEAWRRRILQSHRITRERYVSQTSELQGRVARFDVLLDHNPFTLEASQHLASLLRRVRSQTQDPSSPWHGAQFSTTGTVVGIADLRSTTQADQSRIQLWVTLGVWSVLLFMLRKPLLCTFLIFTVLLSYFATMGVTYGVFSSLYADYSGIDWKVPIFLFVILVAVGQDYNVYLVTRIFEEQRHVGCREAVRRALEVTGGIITSCGAVMAGTFVAMTSPAVLHWAAQFVALPWIDSQAPVLRGITELGFALSFGILLDTLVVRSMLVPAFVVLTDRIGKAELPTVKQG